MFFKFYNLNFLIVICSTIQCVVCEIGSNKIELFISSRQNDVTAYPFGPFASKFSRLVASYLVIENSRSVLDTVVYQNGSEVDTSDIKMLRIETGNPTVKFIPTGIKKKFPDLFAIKIAKSGLLHLEREDMRQFGSSLIYANFMANLLTALEGDLFEFNSNLKRISFKGNPLQYISATLFENFKNIKNYNLENVQFLRSTCIDQESWDPRSTRWNTNKCNDKKAKGKILATINDREEFFSKIFPDMKFEKFVKSSLKIVELKDELIEMKRDIAAVKKDSEDIKSSLKNIEFFLKHLI